MSLGELQFRHFYDSYVVNHSDPEPEFFRRQTVYYFVHLVMRIVL